MLFYFKIKRTDREGSYARLRKREKYRRYAPRRESEREREREREGESCEAPLRERETER